MTKLRYMVREFHETYGVPVRLWPDIPSDERLSLRFKLHDEEHNELRVGLGVNHYGAPVAKPDMVEIVDGIGDLMYVLEGTALELGVDMSPILAEIHRSNMSKLGANGRPVLREDGKITKGPNYSPPDIAGELRKQGWL